jgi:ribosomal RNA-processing protein 17
MGKRPAKNRSTKTAIVFDETARTEYLTGFRKRKDERRKKAKEQMEKEVKDELKRAK